MRDWRRPLRETWQKLYRIRASPGEVAGGFSIGLFVSFLPIISFRTVTAMAVAWLFRQNVLASVIGKSITLIYFPLLPLLWLAEFKLGALLLPVQTPAKLDFTRPANVLRLGWDAWAAMCVGSVLIAAPVTAAGYYIVRRVASRWPVNRPHAGAGAAD